MLSISQLKKQIIVNSIKRDDGELAVSSRDYEYQSALRAMLGRGYLKSHNDVYLLMKKSIKIWEAENAKKSN